MTQHQFTVVVALLGTICGLLTVAVVVGMPLLAVRLNRIERTLAALNLQARDPGAPG